MSDETPATPVPPTVPAPDTPNETIVIEHPSPEPPKKHIHHHREVIVKAGINSVVLEPMTIPPETGPTTTGHVQRHRYVRTADRTPPTEKTPKGLAIFRTEELSAS